MDHRMTRDQLREALSEVGIKTQVKLKKPELVKLYREHVLDQEVSHVSPNDSLIGGFSSDEEEPVSLDTSHINSNTNVAELTNDELFYKLKDLGETVGPILDSTRSIYERKLTRILSDDESILAAKDVSAFSADEGENDKDETDEYEIQMNGLKSEEKEELEDGGHLKTTRTVEEKVEKTDAGDVVRIRRAATLQTYTNKNTTNGKSFVPPPPKKRNVTAIGLGALALLVVLALLIWVNYAGGRTFQPIPSNVVPPPVRNSAN